MAHDYLIFDFGADEAAAQQARHKIEGWKQAFRLDKKVLMKFDRQETPGDGSGKAAAAKASSGEGKGTAQKKAGGKEKEGKSEAGGNVRVLIRLDFSDHEKLSHQRWLDRIPSEAPFKSAKSEIVRQDGPAFAATAELFESLD
jgi:hypothetical protein